MSLTPLDRQLAIDPHRPSVIRLESEYGDLGSSPGLTTNRRRPETVKERDWFYQHHFSRQAKTRVCILLVFNGVQLVHRRPPHKLCTASNKTAGQAAVHAVERVSQM